MKITVKTYSSRLFYLIGALVFSFTSSMDCKSQTYFGLQTGVYTSYLGRVTNPGWGLGAGFEKPLSEKVHLLIQLSFSQNRAKDPELPQYTIEFIENKYPRISLWYLRDMNFNMTYSNLDICFSYYKRDRLDLAIAVGSGFSLCYLGAERIRPYVEGDPARKWDFFYGLGLDLGTSCKYLINERLTWRVGLNSMLTTSMYWDDRIVRFALSSGLIFH